MGCLVEEWDNIAIFVGLTVMFWADNPSIHGLLWQLTYQIIWAMMASTGLHKDQLPCFGHAILILSWSL
jgi:hypothetical protein